MSVKIGHFSHVFHMVFHIHTPSSVYPWVGRCGVAPHTLTLFKTNIADFPIPCLRQNSDF